MRDQVPPPTQIPESFPHNNVFHQKMFNLINLFILKVQF